MGRGRGRGRGRSRGRGRGRGRVCARVWSHGVECSGWPDSPCAGTPSARSADLGLTPTLTLTQTLPLPLPLPLTPNLVQALPQRDLPISQRRYRSGRKSAWG